MDSSAVGIIARRLDHQAIVELNLHPDIVTLAAKIHINPQASEFAEEEKAVDRAVSKRRREFRAGRSLARTALRHLNFCACAIPCNEDRSPCWPHGVCGSISHTNDVVVVAVTAAPNLVGLGIDVEKAGSVESNLRAMIRADECETVFDDTLLFSAKEAVFKAVYPICGEFLEFADVSIVKSDECGGFEAHGRSGLHSSTSFRHGTGRFIRVGNLVVTIFWIYKRYPIMGRFI